MRLVRTVFLAVSVLYPVFGQSYTISTFAGGGGPPPLPIGIPGTSAYLGVVLAAAVDQNANVLFISGQIVLRLDA